MAVAVMTFALNDVDMPDWYSKVCWKIGKT